MKLKDFGKASLQKK